MIPLRLDEIATTLGATLAGADDGAARPAGVVRIDSRDVEPGDVFVCVRGEDLDGHDFVPQAIERGAVLTIAARPVPGPHLVVDDVVASLGRLARAVLDRRPGIAVVGITGSSGKTSTKDLLAQVLESAGPTVSPPGSFNNELGLPITVLRTVDDTRFLVLEMGARGVGHIRELCEVARPDVGVVVNVGSAHVGEFGDRSTIARAKGELVESLPADGVAVLNADDPAVLAMASRTRARVVTFGRGDHADVRAERVSLDETGRASFDLLAHSSRSPVHLATVGAHQVSNALAAAAAALALDVPLPVVADALSRAVARSRWRMEVTESADGVTVVNDAYNANPESVRAALEALVALGSGRRTWAVLGRMGELGPQSEQEHRAVGEVVASLGVDRLLVVGQAAAALADGAREGGMAEGDVDVVPDATAAVASLRARLGPNDVVLVKASRAEGLETVADALLTPPPTPPPNDPPEPREETP